MKKIYISHWIFQKYKYKAGIGFKYLDDFINKDIFETSVKEYLEVNKLKETTTTSFRQILESKTEKNIDWFFNDYLNSREKIDYKIKRVSTTSDSITLVIKNKREKKRTEK